MSVPLLRLVRLYSLRVFPTLLHTAFWGGTEGHSVSVSLLSSRREQGLRSLVGHPRHHTITWHHICLSSPGPKLLGVLVLFLPSPRARRKLPFPIGRASLGIWRAKSKGVRIHSKTVVPLIYLLLTLTGLSCCSEFIPMDTLTSGLSHCLCSSTERGNVCLMQRCGRGKNRKSITFLLSL